MTDLGEFEDRNCDGKFDFFLNFQYSGTEVTQGETLADSETDLDGDDIPDGTDTDGDGLQDGLEVAGWYVEVYFERNPNIRFKPVHVWSDPLDADCDNDGLDDTNESLYGGDPHKSDTDGDGIGDADENEYGSSIDGIEATAPKIEGNLSCYRDYDWEKIKLWGITIGYRLEVEIVVSGVATDNVGIKYVYIEVDSTGIFEKTIMRPRNENEAKRYRFLHKFEIPMSICSLVSDFWSGWDIYVNISDVNGNTADKKDHISSVIEALVDAIAEFVSKLVSMILEWLKEKAKSLMNKVVKAIEKGLTKLFSPLLTPLITSIFLLLEGGNRNSLEECIEQFKGPFWILFGIIAFLYLATTILFAIVTAVTFGAATVISIILNLIVPIIVLSIISSMVTGDNPFSSFTDFITGGIQAVFDFANTLLTPAVDLIIDVMGAECLLFDMWDVGDVLFAAGSAFFLLLGAIGALKIVFWDILGLCIDIIGCMLALLGKTIASMVDLAMDLGEKTKDWIDFICDLGNVFIQILGFLLIWWRQDSEGNTETCIRIFSIISGVFGVIQVVLGGYKVIAPLLS